MVSAGEPEGKKPLGRPSSRKENNYTTEFRQTERDGMGWIHLANDKLVVSSCQDGNELPDFIKCCVILE
jgi:hypothetical protein